MEEIIGRLRPDFQEMLRLRYAEELPYTEIAERLRMSPTAVGEKLWRIRDLLRSRLRKEDSIAFRESGIAM